MAIIVNGTKIAKLGNTAIKSVIANGVEVWKADYYWINKGAVDGGISINKNEKSNASDNVLTNDSNGTYLYGKSWSGANFGQVFARSTKAIDLSDYSTLTIQYSVNGSAGYGDGGGYTQGYVCLAPSGTTPPSFTAFNQSNILSGTSCIGSNVTSFWRNSTHENLTVTIDISSLTGNYYLWLNACAYNSGNTTVYAHIVHLE